MIICDFVDKNVEDFIKKDNAKRIILTFFKEPFDNYKGNKVIFIDDILDNNDYLEIDIFTKNIIDMLSGSLKIYGYDLFKYLTPSMNSKLCKIYKYKYAIDKISRIKNIYCFVCFTSENSLIEWLKIDYEIFSPSSYKEKPRLTMKIRKKIIHSKLRYIIESFVTSSFLKDRREKISNLLWLVGERTIKSQLPNELRKDFKIFLFDNHSSYKKSFIKRGIKFNLLKLQNYKKFIKICRYTEQQYTEIMNKVALKMGIRLKQAEMILNLSNDKIRDLLLHLCILEDNIKNLNLLITVSSIHNYMGLAVDFFRKHKLISIEIVHGLPCGFEYNKNINKIAVYGQRDKLFYTNHGVDTQKVVITGCPRYDKFFHIREKQKKYNHLLLILDWVTFSSSSRTSMEIFQQVMCMLRLLEQLRKVKLVIKLHPLQTKSELMYIRGLVFKNNYYKKYVEVVKDSDTTELLRRASIVFTHSSSVGLEALLMKKPVIILDIHSGFKPVYKGYNGFLIAKDFVQVLMLTKKVLKDIDEYLRSNSKNIEKTIKFFYADSKGECYKQVANLARNCVNEYKRSAL